MNFSLYNKIKMILGGNMKKFLGVILTASMVMSSFTPVLAEEQNKIKVDRIARADRYET